MRILSRSWNSQASSTQDIPVAQEKVTRSSVAGGWGLLSPTPFSLGSPLFCQAVPVPLRLQLHSGVFCLSPIPQEEVTVETSSPQPNKMDKLMEILNSMRNNSSDVDAKLTSFMEEAQNSTNSEEMLEEIVRTIYQKAVSDRSFAFTAAKLCDKMALFMVEGTKFRSLLLNMLQVTRHQQLPLRSPAPPTRVIARERAASSDGG